MDDIVAVKVRDSGAGVHYFLTWGRIFDRVDPKDLEVVVAKHAAAFGIRSPLSAALCESLQEACRSRYFYEACFHLAQEKIPVGKRAYNLWRAKKKKQLLSGKQLFYCGAPKKKAPK